MQNAVAQTYEAGVFVGGTNFIGDVGATDYISPNLPAFGGIFKWNRSPRHSFRATVIYAQIEGLDSKSDDPRRLQRNFSFNNTLLEISAGIEFTFLDFNLHQPDLKGTPYLYTGVSTARHNNYFFNNIGERIDENTKSWAYGIPMVIGYKTMLTTNIIFALEIGARYTFSDEIDGSVSDNVGRQQFNFGNINNDDWYVFSGVTLTYTFGRKPCFCTF